MGRLYSVYCDESCHLLTDPYSVMVLGGIWCPKDIVRDVTLRLREIKIEHGLSRQFELKWTKVSPGQLAYYEAVVELFFANADLHFRALIIPDKSSLNHEVFGQTHDEWYHKMYYAMLRPILHHGERYQLFVDHKDTHSGSRIAKLDQVLRASLHDPARETLMSTQVVHSHEVEILQLADLLIGATAYTNRGLTTSRAKSTLVDLVRRRSGLLLTETTALSQTKVNLLRWSPSEVDG